MRSRATVLTLGLFLSLVLSACSKKTDQTADNSAANPAQSSSTAAPAQPAQTQPAPAPPAPAAPAPPPPIVVPSGTAVTVRLAQSVGSKISQAGQSFSGTVADSVAVGGRTAIPAGAKVSGTVVDAKPLGRFAGGASLSLRLNSVDINGMGVPITTSSVTQVEKGKGKRTAVLAGGGAAVGALIGGLAGGGKGAGIGALAGGGAGTGGAAFTGNKDIVLPAESALTFTLSQPLEIQQQ
jgi:hypothetical protein